MTDEKRKTPSAVEKWNHAVREAYEGDDPGAKAVLEATDEEIDRELRAAGIDVEAEDAKAMASYEAAMAKLDARAGAGVSETQETRGDVGWVKDSAPRGKVVPLPQRSGALWVAYVIAAAAAIGGATYVAGRQKPAPPPPPMDLLPPAPPPSAAPPTPPEMPVFPSPTPPTKGDKAPH
jgi:hypothetical protein